MLTTIIMTTLAIMLTLHIGYAIGVAHTAYAVSKEMKKLNETAQAYKEMCDRAIAIAQEINNERRREGGQTA